jgi:hypothetical protein
MPKIRVLIFILSILIIGSVGAFAVAYAKGYRLGVKKNSITISPSGILVVNSDPTGAQVLINGDLKTATNNTITLAPDTYDITIQREGYVSWNKKLVINQEAVTQIDAFLIQSAPSLTALTFSGIMAPVPSPDHTKIAYGVPSTKDNNGKAGLWVLEMANLPLGFNRDPRQITDLNLTDATWQWSPDATEVLLTTKSGVYLLATNTFTPQADLENVLTTTPKIKTDWQVKEQKRLDSQLARLPDELKEDFKSFADKISLSPDETRVLYQASKAAELKDGVIRPLPGASTQTQERKLTVGKWYVFDIKEDRNFAVGEKNIQNIYWLANSLNLMIAEENKISILDYDGNNKQTIYTGSYIYPHAYPSTNSNRLIILTNLGSTDSPPNLYWLSLK